MILRVNSSYTAKHRLFMWFCNSDACALFKVGTECLLVTDTGWFLAKRLMQLRPFSDLLCSPNEF
jgi:hypothetical protein